MYYHISWKKTCLEVKPTFSKISPIMPFGLLSEPTEPYFPSGETFSSYSNPTFSAILLSSSGAYPVKEVPSTITTGAT